jgi:hypothetical protein
VDEDDDEAETEEGVLSPPNVLLRGLLGLAVTSPLSSSLMAPDDSSQLEVTSVMALVLLQELIRSEVEEHSLGLSLSTRGPLAVPLRVLTASDDDPELLS